uniref:CHK kinase-like domain-containing protein n=1 Tax=Panagrolaimus davidi TaxID=227884 RepID=A0A914R0J3_9BILA
MHSGNLLWKINKNGEIQNELEAIVDWQIVHEGSQMADLARFLVHTADGNIRREAETFAFDFYRECLLKEFGGDSSKVPYNVEQLRKAYYYVFALQAFFTLQLMPVFFTAVKHKYESKDEQKAIYDKGIQKALDAYNDLDRIYNEEMKDVFEKYGL